MAQAVRVRVSPKAPITYIKQLVMLFISCLCGTLVALEYANRNKSASTYHSKIHLFTRCYLLLSSPYAPRPAREIGRTTIKKNLHSVALGNIFGIVSKAATGHEECLGDFLVSHYPKQFANGLHPDISLTPCLALNYRCCLPGVVLIQPDVYAAVWTESSSLAPYPLDLIESLTDIFIRLPLDLTDYMN